MVLTVRQYQPPDFPRLLEIDQSCFVEGIAYSKEEMRYFLSMPTAISLVGLQAEETAGFIIADRFRPRFSPRRQCLRLPLWVIETGPAFFLGINDGNALE